MRAARSLAYFAQPFTALAHRGGSLLPQNRGRENTLFAFRNAVALGYTHVETDVHATRDGHLVAFHDDSLARVSDREGEVADTSFAEVRRARVGGEQIPTLDELLEELPDTFVNIDIKAPGAVEPLVAALQAHHAWHRVCVGSFSPARLNRFRRLAGGRAATAVGPVGVAWTARMPVLPRYLASPGQAFQMPLSQLVRGHRVQLLTPWLLDAAHRRGKVVHVWTVNDRQQMEALIDLGVDGIVTDAVDVLRDVLVGRGLWYGGEQSLPTPR